MRQLLAIGIALVTCLPVHAAAPLIVAHRGASADAPENTLPSFQLAWSRDADAIEGDFYLTEDGQIVCIHDADTKRVAGKKLVVKKSTLEELRALDVGRWRGDQWANTKIPTLAEVLATVPKGKRIYIEIKDTPAILPKLFEGIKDSGLSSDQVVLISFKADVIREAKIQAPSLKAYWLAGFKKDDAGQMTPTPETILATLQETGADGFSSSEKGVTEAIVRQVQEAGYEYHVWTVDDLDTARRFRQWGALSITTNMPGYLKAGLAECGDSTDERAAGSSPACCGSRPPGCSTVRHARGGRRPSSRVRFFGCRGGRNRP